MTRLYSTGRSLTSTVLATRRRRKAFVDHTLTSFGCRQCGFNEDARALHIDHIVPVSEGGGGDRQLKGYNLKDSTFLKRFLHPNLQVLCANCHAIKGDHGRKSEHE